MTAVLHDVVEDTDFKLDHLHGLGYPDDVLEAITYLSKKAEEKDCRNDTVEEKRRKYNSFIQRVSKGPLMARRIKVVDLLDNSDPSRINGEATEQDRQRWAKYESALRVLLTLV